VNSTVSGGWQFAAIEPLQMAVTAEVMNSLRSILWIYRSLFRRR
jgi:hypothetical protein